MDPKQDTLQIIRVANGWMVRPFGYTSREGLNVEVTFVATTPEKLCSLLKEWAFKQSDLAEGGA